LVTKINQYTELTASLQNQLNEEQTRKAEQLKDAQNEIEQLKLLSQSLENDNLILNQRLGEMEAEKSSSSVDEDKHKEAVEELTKLKTQLDATNKKLDLAKKENKSLKTSTIEQVTKEHFFWKGRLLGIPLKLTILILQAKYDEILDKNRALTEWRRQLVTFKFELSSFSSLIVNEIF